MKPDKTNWHARHEVTAYKIATRGGRYDWKQTAANIWGALSKAHELGWIESDVLNHYADFEIKSVRRYLTKSDGTLGKAQESIKSLDEWYFKQ